MLFDAHGDILTDLYQEATKGHHESFRKRHLASYKEAGITHSIFVNWTNPSTDNPTEFQDITSAALQELNHMTDIFHIIKTADDMDRSLEEDKIGVILGMEGLSQLNDINELTELYNKGFRHASLTWNEVNRYAGGLSSDKDGLTLLGKSLLSEMESLGMIIDLAHANPVTFHDILTHTTGPVIISHGNTKALCNHIRNYTDEQLLQIKDRGGVVGICGIASFIAEEQEHRTVKKMAAHIDYAVKLIGIDHVGIGFDVCYYLSEHAPNNGVKGFETIAEAGNVFEELRKLGYNEDEIHKIKYANFARIVKQVMR